MRFAQRDWTVVGHFDAGGSGFDSEMWGDVDQLMQSFRRTTYSSMIVRLARGDAFERFRSDIDVDPRLADEAKREQVFYGDQSKALSTFINILGFTLSTIFSIAAMIGAMITMYASVASRVAEIGTLRARLQAQRRAARLSARSVAARIRGRHGGPVLCRIDAIRFLLDDEFSDLRRLVLPLHSHAVGRDSDCGLFAHHGLRRWLPACA